jgi:hypothetical protein
MENPLNELYEDLYIARLDYLDNKGSNDADEFYRIYFQAYNAYMRVKDPSKIMPA